MYMNRIFSLDDLVRLDMKVNGAKSESFLLTWLKRPTGSPGFPDPGKPGGPGLPGSPARPSGPTIPETPYRAN